MTSGAEEVFCLRWDNHQATTLISIARRGEQSKRLRFIWRVLGFRRDVWKTEMLRCDGLLCQSNLRSTVCSLLEDKESCDVMVVVEGHTLPAHRLVLMAGSEYFRSLLGPLPPASQPILILAGLTLAQVKSVLEYIYYGEISIR